ncbi:MAG: 4Fe-4S binding protein [Deltaproteobacteria bacterium]|nr:4Fe-4S binding protein [Deltaproteobacteria bacterium]MDW8002997.1 4Fe-4S binding protein [Deltaproteobacteria bacterium]
MIPDIKIGLCVMCGKCEEVCPTDAIHLSSGFVYIETDFCEECGICAANCPTGAIAIKFPVFERA